jgi:hypothetical protein
LNTSRDHEELYHDEYDTVAVMFASLTEYVLWDDSSVEGANELSSIKLLNQIICDFDQVNSRHDISTSIFNFYLLPYILSQVHPKDMEIVTI